VQGRDTAGIAYMRERVTLLVVLILV